MTAYLQEIVAHHRELAAVDGRDVEELIEMAGKEPSARGFRRALYDHWAAYGVGVVAEIKRRSPSKGPIAPDLDPAALAIEYERGGAACLSVLTDDRYFGGSPGDLRAARQAAGLPVLRKDFTVSTADVADARLMGADAILLIAAALEEAELASLHHLAGRLGLDALVEIHDERELDQVLALGASLIGVNQRDLHTFEVDTGLAVKLRRRIPDSVVTIAESGIMGPGDAMRLADAGYHAILVGEHLVRAADRAEAVRKLADPNRSVPCPTKRS